MNRTRPKQIVIRVSEEEYAAIKEKVQQSGKNQQEYIIAALTKKSIVNTAGIKDVYIEMKRQGVNLNQIARRLNEGEILNMDELRSVLEGVGEAWQSLRLYLQELK